jgi:VanZ family protein
LQIETRSEPTFSERTQVKPASHGPLYYWLPAIGWLVLQAMFSTGIFTSDHTGLVLTAILKFFHAHFNYSQLEELNHIVRKCAHFSTYAILSWLLFRAIRGNSPEKAHRHVLWMLVALGIAFAAASADEIHQIFVSGRTPAWRDVALDMTGAVFAQLMIIWHESSKRSSATKNLP